MLYLLLYPLSKYISGFNIFKYITFRTAYATITAMLISFIFGSLFIQYLKRKQIKENIRAEGPKTHKAKEGTPTMGGLLILISVIVPTLLWADLKNTYIQLILLVTVWMGLLGFYDDYLKAIKGQKKGIVARKKLIGQLTIGLILGYILYVYPPDIHFTTATEVPFFKNLFVEFGVFYIPFVALVITGASNAVNLTDGLDGLAIGLVGICGLGLAILAYITGRSDFSRYLNIEYFKDAGELTIFCGSLVGACLGFLWFNSNPAQVFMGDTGALALGGALGGIALMIKKEILLVIMGGVFVMVALSVIIQVVYFRLSKGKRVFKMAPIHHHFELCGWAEQKVTVRFWILGIIFALISMSTLKIR
jgi:phospho-N-acetylmuramoyl-pentapeptide-transferase